MRLLIDMLIGFQTLLRCLVFCSIQWSASGQTDGDVSCGLPLEHLSPTSYACGELTVPENHQDPSSRQITIKYLILKSSSDLNLAPMIYFSGGPGGAALTHGRIANWSRNPMLEHRDIILFDQRGTGQSSPLPGMEEKLFELMGADLTHREELSAMKDIQQKVKRVCTTQGIDLRQYNSFQNAHDVLVLMKALKYPKYNLYGVSYGTRLARIVQDLAPAMIHSVVLNSPNPLKGDFLVDRLHSYSIALERIMTFCENDDACRQDYPNLRDTYFAALTALKKQPATTQINGSTFHINEQDALYFVRRMLYRNDAKERVPLTIRALQNHDEHILKEVVQSELIFSNNYNSSMWLSVERHEMFDPNHTADRLKQVYDGLPLLPTSLGLFHSFYLAGMDWHNSTLGAEDKKFKPSAVPTLVTVNYYDPVTPPEDAEIMMRHLSEGQLYILDEGGHGGGNAACRYQVMHAFMSDPKAPLDVSCLRIHRK